MKLMVSSFIILIVCGWRRLTFRFNDFFRSSDIIDIVTDQTYTADYYKDEDPKLFVSEKTSRGPLADDWLSEYWNEVQIEKKYWIYFQTEIYYWLYILFHIKVKGKTQPTEKNLSLMCAYKLCRVEFRYWGMQTKLEKFIHDIGGDYVIFYNRTWTID